MQFPQTADAHTQEFINLNVSWKVTVNNNKKAKVHFICSMSFNFRFFHAVDRAVTQLSQQCIAILEVISESPVDTEDSVCRTTNQTDMTLGKMA